MFAFFGYTLSLSIYIYTHHLVPCPLVGQVVAMTQSEVLHLPLRLFDARSAHRLGFKRGWKARSALEIDDL